MTRLPSSAACRRGSEGARCPPPSIHTFQGRGSVGVKHDVRPSGKQDRAPGCAAQPNRLPGSGAGFSSRYIHRVGGATLSLWPQVYIIDNARPKAIRVAPPARVFGGHQSLARPAKRIVASCRETAATLIPIASFKSLVVGKVRDHGHRGALVGNAGELQVQVERPGRRLPTSTILCTGANPGVRAITAQAPGLSAKIVKSPCASAVVSTK